WTLLIALASVVATEIQHSSGVAVGGQIGLLLLDEGGARPQGGEPHQAEHNPYHLAEPPDERIGEPQGAPEAQGAEDGDIAALERSQGRGDHEGRELDGGAESLEYERRDDRGVGPEEDEDEVDLETAGGPRRRVQERGREQGAAMLAVESGEPAIHRVEPALVPLRRSSPHSAQDAATPAEDAEHLDQD